MATETLTTLANGLRQNYGNEIVMSLVDSGGSHLKSIVPPNSAIGRLAVNNRIFFTGMGADRGGRYAAQFPVYYSAGAAASYAQGDAYPSATNVSIAQALAEWARYWIPMEMDGLAIHAAQGNSVVGDLDSIALEFELKLKALFSRIENDMVKAQSGNNLSGVKTWMTNTGNFEGLSLTNSWWQPALKDATSNKVTRAMIREVFAQLADQNARPNEIWCSRTQYNLIAEVLGADIQYIEVASVEGLIRTFTLDGVPVFAIDSMEPSGNAVNDEIWFMNTDQMSLHFLPQDTPQTDVELETMPGSFEGYPVGIKPIDPGHDAESMIIKCYPQLVCKNPSQFGAIFALATS